MAIRQFNPDCMFLCMRWPDYGVAADSMMFVWEWQRCSSVKLHVPLFVGKISQQFRIAKRKFLSRGFQNFD